MELQEYPPKYHTALRLLIPVWRGLDSNYKSKYARSIWQQFEDNIRSAAYASTVSRFYNNLCSRLAIAIDARGVADVNAVLAISGAEERALLRQLRDETSTLALMVRLENDIARAQWAARKNASKYTGEPDPITYLNKEAAAYDAFSAAQEEIENE